MQKNDIRVVRMKQNSKVDGQTIKQWAKAPLKLNRAHPGDNFQWVHNYECPLLTWAFNTWLQKIYKGQMLSILKS